MVKPSQLQIVDALIPLLGQLNHGNAVGIQVKEIFACVDRLKQVSNWTLGHALASLKLRALAAGLALEYLDSNAVDPHTLERMKGAFHELRTYAAADMKGA